MFIKSPLYENLEYFASIQDYHEMKFKNSYSTYI